MFLFTSTVNRPFIKNADNTTANTGVLPFLDQLKSASTEDLKNGVCDEMIKDILSKPIDREMCRDLAYLLFSGDRYEPFGYVLKLLRYLLLDSELAVADLKQV